jgi:RimJ/RimL family protein N-acetyltransferase
VWLIEKLPKDIDRVEAYAHRENRKSQSILEYLGLRAVPETFGNEYILYRGSFAHMKEKITQKKEEMIDG